MHCFPGWQFVSAKLVLELQLDLGMTFHTR